MASLMTFLVLIVLALLHLTQSAASTHTQTVSTYFLGMGEILAAGDHHETGKLVVRRRSSLNLNRKETYENTRFLGRKPALKLNRILLGMVKAEVDLNGGQFSKSTATCSGSSSSMRNSSNMKNNVGPQRLRNIISSRAHRRVKVKTFIPLNADYHVPKPHPPKNN